MQGHSATGEDEEESGGSLLAQWPLGDVCLAWPLQGSRQGWVITPLELCQPSCSGSSRRNRGDGETPQASGMRCQACRSLRQSGCGHMWIFKGEIAEYYLLFKAIAWRFKAFLPAQNKWCELWKIQQCVSLFMQAIAITYFYTCFKILQRLVLYWTKNAKQV